MQVIMQPLSCMLCALASIMQFNTLAEQTLGRVKKVGSEVDTVKSLLRGAMENCGDADIVGQYSLQGKANMELVSRLKNASKDPNTLVVLIADECHWGTGAPAAQEEGRRPRKRVRTAGAGAGNSRGDVGNDLDAAEDGSASCANHFVRPLLPTISLPCLGPYGKALDFVVSVSPMIFKSEHHGLGLHLQMLNSFPDLTNPEHGNVISLLVSATPFCLLTRDSRVPRLQRRVQAGVMSDSDDRHIIVDLDDEVATDVHDAAVDVADVHVVDWSEMTLRSLMERPLEAHFRAHLGCAGEEDGYWYVDVDKDDYVAVVCKPAADDGGRKISVQQVPGDKAGLVTLQCQGSVGPAHVVVRACVPTDNHFLALTEDATKASRFHVHLGLGAGLLALSLSGGDGSDSNMGRLYVAAPDLDAVEKVMMTGEECRLTLVDCGAGSTSALPVRCQFRLAYPAHPSEEVPRT